MRMLATFVLGLAMSVATVSAQVIVDVTNDSAWTIIQDDDADATFGFDYSVFGIPPAPGSDDTLGVRLSANMAEPAEAAGISISPTDITLNGRVQVSVDIWLNYYADIENRGTTEFAGLFVGYDQEGVPLNGAGLLGSTDGDALEDYRMYANGNQLALDSGQYLVESLNHTDPFYAEIFPSQEIPAEQLDDFDPPNEFVLSSEGSLAFAWHTFTADVDTNAGEVVFSIDENEIGFVATDLNPEQLVSGNLAVTFTDIFGSVAPEDTFAFAVIDNVRVDFVDGVLPGDFDADGDLTANDIDIISNALRAGTADPMFDLDGSGEADNLDRGFLIQVLMNTWFGDSNIDGLFDTSDFVATFTRGKYESGTGDATWADGDWNGDGNFDSSDFVTAFSNGGYEAGPRQAIAVAVPEPGAMALAGLGGLLLVASRRKIV